MERDFLSFSTVFCFLAFILIKSGFVELFLHNSSEERTETTILEHLPQAKILPFISKWPGSYLVNTLTGFKDVLRNAVIIIESTTISIF